MQTMLSVVPYDLAREQTEAGGQPADGWGMVLWVILLAAMAVAAGWGALEARRLRARRQ